MKTTGRHHSLHALLTVMETEANRKIGQYASRLRCTKHNKRNK